ETQRQQRPMLSETVEFNISVLVARGGPNSKSSFFPLITCRNECVEIVTVGIATSGTEKSIPTSLITVKTADRGRVDVETTTERGRVGSDCSAINIEAAIKEICIRMRIPTSQTDRKVR